MTHRNVDARRMAVAAMATGAIAVIGTGTSPAWADVPTARNHFAVKAAPEITGKTECRSAASKIKGATVTARVCWSGKKVRVSGVVRDTMWDHREACVKIRYVDRVVRTATRACVADGRPGASKRWTDALSAAGQYRIMACTRSTLKRWQTVCDGKWR